MEGFLFSIFLYILVSWSFSQNQTGDEMRQMTSGWSVICVLHEITVGWYTRSWRSIVSPHEKPYKNSINATKSLPCMILSPESGIRPLYSDYESEKYFVLSDMNLMASSLRLTQNQPSLMSLFVCENKWRNFSRDRGIYRVEMYSCERYSFRWEKCGMDIISLYDKKLIKT